MVTQGQLCATYVGQLLGLGDNQLVACSRPKFQEELGQEVGLISSAEFAVRFARATSLVIYCTINLLIHAEAQKFAVNDLSVYTIFTQIRFSVNDNTIVIANCMLVLFQNPTLVTFLHVFILSLLPNMNSTWDFISLI